MKIDTIVFAWNVDGTPFESEYFCTVESHYDKDGTLNVWTTITPPILPQT